MSAQGLRRVTRRRLPADPDIANADEIASMLGVGRRQVYEAAGRGEIPHRRIGDRLIFSRQAVREWLGCKGASREQD
jgi:excisionase family DNA binding protein